VFGANDEQPSEGNTVVDTVDPVGSPRHRNHRLRRGWAHHRRRRQFIER